MVQTWYFSVSVHVSLKTHKTPKNNLKKAKVHTDLIYLFWLFKRSSVTFRKCFEAMLPRSGNVKQTRPPLLVLTMQKLIPQHGLLLHPIHGDFYTGDIVMEGVVRLWEEGGTRLQHRQGLQEHRTSWL